MKSAILLLAAGLASLSAPALAQNFSVSQTLRGWYNSPIGVTTLGPNNNYVAGNCGTCLNPGEYRNYFDFTLPSFTGVVTSATLKLDAAGVTAGQGSSITYQLTSTPGLNFADLGTGTLYASGTFTAAAAGTTLVFSLNSAALQAMGSGASFRLGGRVLAPLGFGSDVADHLLFGGSSRGLTMLEFTVGQRTPGGVPEPASWAMLIAGFGLTGAAMRRRRVVLAA